MKKITVKALVALVALGTSGIAAATQVYLNQVGARAGSGTRYVFFTNGLDSGATDALANPVGLAGDSSTWDWAGGVLTQTGGTFEAHQRLGSSPAGDLLVADKATGLVIDTNAGTTTATSYNCVDGAFNMTINSNCYNTANGGDAARDSSVAYNVGGNADCEVRTIGDDDAPGTAAPAGFRGLRDHGSDEPEVDCGDNTGRGALDMIYVVENNLGSGGLLILAGWNSLKGPMPIGNCINAGSVPNPSPPDETGGCGRAHWLIFSGSVPVPAAVWLFGSALGVLGAVRRRAKA